MAGNRPTIIDGMEVDYETVEKVSSGITNALFVTLNWLRLRCIALGVLVNT